MKIVVLKKGTLWYIILTHEIHENLNPTEITNHTVHILELMIVLLEILWE